MNRDELTELILAQLDGRLSSEESAPLEAELRDSEEARQLYVKFARLDAKIRESGESQAKVVRESEQIVRMTPAARRSSWLRSAAIAALFAVLGVAAGWLLQRPVAEEIFASTDTVENGVAVITEMVDVVWGDGSLRATENKTLPPGKIILDSGLVQMDFLSGASVTIEGPATLELVNRMEAVVLQGRLKADVPPAARGFSLRSKDITLVDLGTTFAVSVEPGKDEPTDLYVFDGKVVARDKDGEELAVTKGESARFLANRHTGNADTPKKSFRGIDDVLEQSANANQGRYESWKQFSNTLRQDPRLIFYFDFEDLNRTTRRLPNVAQSGGGSDLDGGIVGVTVANGRWPQKSALDFRRPGDRIRMEVPGQFDQLTLFAWVRIDALDRVLNSLFLTDYFDPGDIHWQISNKGTLNFASSPMGAVDVPKYNRRFFSEPFWTPAQSGRWFFLATVADHTNNRVQHYINGEPVGISDGTNMDKPLARMQIGPADIGNWTDPINPNWGIRTLNGRIDEMGIFSAALTDEEILTIYEAGKP